MGHEPVLAPCLTITRLAPVLPENPAAIIVTSMQAIPALPARYCNLPVFCVGDATAGRLRQNGFASVESASGDAKDLYRLIIARRVDGVYLLASGARQGVRLARSLAAAGIDVMRVSVYAARPVQALTGAACALLEDRMIGAALFYSAETAKAFIQLAPPGTEAVTALALSRPIATALRRLPWAQIRVATAPTEADLLALL
jgi:uroporphyrinogen-III synthase